MRRLVTDDEDVLREAWAWDADRPIWYRQADGVFNCGGVDDLVSQLADSSRVFIGVWSDVLEGVVIAEWKGGGYVEGHLLARPRADTELLGVAIQRVLLDLTNYGLTHAFAWVAERNIGIRRLCANIALQPDGVVMWRGSYHGKPIKWLRHSVQREQLLMQQVA
jgi:hypothetical protein